MIIQIKDILKSIEIDAPKSLAESWDNVGLLVGESGNKVRKILVGLDPTTSLVQEAISLSADTIITHHPIIFRPLANIDTSCPTGKVIQQSLINNISLIACHTNLDSAEQGVSTILADRLGLKNPAPLLPHAGTPHTGTGCIAEFAEPVAIDEFCSSLLSTLSLETFQLAGPMPSEVKRVALCGGSGSSFAEDALKLGADLYISAEIKHDVARWAEECHFCIIDAGHYATEQFAVSLIANGLRRRADLLGWEVEVVESESEKSPFVNIDSDSFVSS